MVGKVATTGSKGPRPVVICTGFHRSATSLTAQLMHAGGLDMGRRLVAPHLSNPDGHFEDIDIVNINDQLLGDAGTDWRFHDETPLPKPEAALGALRSYVAVRDAAHTKQGWGVKDPRISLFLPVWERVLGPRGRFILVIRHWGASIQSLFNRHSRVLVEQGLGAGHDREDDHLSFWVRPGLAARMWIAYSRRVLDFAKQANGNVLVLPQPALMAGFDLIGWMNSTWGIKLKAPAPGIIKPDLLTDRIDAAVADMVTPMLRSEMEALWAELLRLACEQLSLDESSESFVPVWSEATRDPLLEASIQHVQRLAVCVTTPVNKDFPKDEPALTGEWTKDDVQKQLRRRSSLPLSLLSKLYAWLEINAPEDSMTWQGCGIRAMKEGALDLAEQAFMRAAATGKAPASLWMHLGQLYERMRNYKRAEYHYREAIRRNAKNAEFVAALARLLVLMYRNEEALTLLEDHIARSGHPALVRLWVRFMTELGRYQAAKERVEILRKEFPEHEDEWSRQMAILNLPLNAKSARESLNEVIRRGVKADDLPVMLAQILRHVDSSSAFFDLSQRMLRNWRTIFPEEEISRVFLG